MCVYENACGCVGLRRGGILTGASVRPLENPNAKCITYIDTNTLKNYSNKEINICHRLREEKGSSKGTWKLGWSATMAVMEAWKVREISRCCVIHPLLPLIMDSERECERGGTESI